MKASAWMVIKVPSAFTPRERKYLAQGHINSGWNWDSNPGRPDSKPWAFNPVQIYNAQFTGREPCTQTSVPRSACWLCLLSLQLFSASTLLELSVSFWAATVRPWAGVHQLLPVPPSAPEGKSEARMYAEWINWIARIPRLTEGKSTNEGNLCLSSRAEARNPLSLF